MRQLLGNIEQFISLIQSRPALYNFTLEEFNDKAVTQKLWEEIASEFNTNVDYCKSKWGTLRVSFARQIRNEKTNSKRSSETLINDWYLKDNMAFMRTYMRKRRKCNPSSSEKDIENYNNDSLSKSSFDVKTETISPNSSIEIKNEPMFLDEDESLASLAIGSNEHLLEDNRTKSDLVPIASSSVTNSETRHSIQNHQAKKSLKTYPVLDSVMKIKALEQEYQSMNPSKKIRTTLELEPLLKKKSNEAEDPLLFISRSNKNEQVDVSNPSQDDKTRNADTTMTFFKSVLPDFNKLTARRQRLVKQMLMESLNRLLDEQESES